MKKGLVLEGGAMLGLFSAGVIDVLMDNGFVFDGVIGVSAGACFGCNYLSGQIGRTIRYNTKYAKDKRYCSVSSLLKTGDIYGAEFCYDTLPMQLDPFDNDAFMKNPAEFYVVASDVVTGEPVYQNLDSLDRDNIEWVRASASMPIVSNIVEINGGKYLDGGITDSIPVKKFHQMGYETTVTVLTKPRAYIKGPNKMMPLIKYMYKDYPGFIEASRIRHIAYAKQRQDTFDMEKEGTNFVICPKTSLPIGHITHDPMKMKEVYDIGVREAREQLPALERFWERRSK